MGIDMNNAIVSAILLQSLSNNNNSDTTRLLNLLNGNDGLGMLGSLLSGNSSDKKNKGLGFSDLPDFGKMTEKTYRSELARCDQYSSLMPNYARARKAMLHDAWNRQSSLPDSSGNGSSGLDLNGLVQILRNLVERLENLRTT